LIADMFTSSFLSDMRRKALRKGVWYKALDALERGILSLTSRVIERVESAVLGVELVKIISKLAPPELARQTFHPTPGYKPSVP